MMGCSYMMCLRVHFNLMRSGTHRLLVVQAVLQLSCDHVSEEDVNDTSRSRLRVANDAKSVVPHFYWFGLFIVYRSPYPSLL